MVRLPGKWIAPRALGWLAGATNPRIHSLYRHSVNFIDAERNVLTAVLPSLGPGPFAIVFSPDENTFEGFDTLDHRVPVTVDGRSIVFGQFHLDSSSAEEWQPRPNWQEFGAKLDEMRVTQIGMMLHHNAPPNSFAPLVSGDLPKPDGTFQSRALHAAANPAERLQTGLADGDVEEMERAAMQLAGLGGGVTPSGDDYLQGVIHALWSKADERDAEHMSAAIMGAAAPRTNAISGAWLKVAARGEAGEDWHLMVRALLSEDQLEGIVLKLIHRGHTSGADAMAGFLSALRVLR